MAGTEKQIPRFASPRHGRVRVLSAVAPIDELDQTGAGLRVIRVFAPLAVEGIECPPAADPHLRDAIWIRLTDPVGVEPRATLANPSALHPGEGNVEGDVSCCRGEREIHHAAVGRGDHVESAGRPCSLPRATLRAGVHGNAPIPDVRVLPQQVMLNPELLQAVERHAGPDTTDWPIEFVRIPPQHEGGRGGTATRGEQYDDPGDAGSTDEHTHLHALEGRHNILFRGAISHVSLSTRVARCGCARACKRGGRYVAPAPARLACVLAPPAC